MASTSLTERDHMRFDSRISKIITTCVSGAHTHLVCFFGYGPRPTKVKISCTARGRELRLHEGKLFNSELVPLLYLPGDKILDQIVQAKFVDDNIERETYRYSSRMKKFIARYLDIFPI